MGNGPKQRKEGSGRVDSTEIKSGLPLDTWLHQAHTQGRERKPRWEGSVCPSLKEAPQRRGVAEPRAQSPEPSLTGADLLFSITVPRHGARTEDGAQTG